jgi:hypothetical protein
MFKRFLFNKQASMLVSSFVGLGIGSYEAYRMKINEKFPEMTRGQTIYNGMIIPTAIGGLIGHLIPPPIVMCLAPILLAGYTYDAVVERKEEKF